MSPLKKHSFYPYTAAFLILGAVAFADAPPATTPATAPAAPVNTAHVDFYRGNIGHTGVSDEKLNAPLSVLWRHTTSYAQRNPASPVLATSSTIR